MADLWRQTAATGVISCTILGVLHAAFAMIAGPNPGLSGYVSEAGIVPGAYALVYRWGIFMLAAAFLLLAAALPAAVRAVQALLVLSAAATVISGAVTCSEGCPLPPFEQTTTADLVHAGASIVAVGACLLVMLLLALSADVPAKLRRICRATLAVALPLAAMIVLAMLTLGRGAVVGVTERVLLGIVAIWLTATGVILRGRGGADDRGPLRVRAGKR